MLIVRQADRVHAHLAHDRHVARDVGLAHRPALALAVLVIADAVQAQRLAVEEQPAFGIDPHLTDAERLLDPVEDAATGSDQLHRQAMEIGIGDAVPEVRVGHVERRRRRPVGSPCQRHRAALLGLHRAGRIDQADDRLDPCRTRGVVPRAPRHVDRRSPAGDRAGRRIDPATAVIEQVEMHVVGDDQADRPIQPAMDEEVARQRQHIGSRGTHIWRAVVDLNQQRVGRTRLQGRGGIEAEARKAARMAAQPFAVQPHLRRATGRVELKIGALAVEVARAGERQLVPADPLIVVERLRPVRVVAGLGVVTDAVPAVRDRNPRPVRRAGRRGLRALGEYPALAQHLRRADVLRGDGRGRHCGHDGKGRCAHFQVILCRSGHAA